MNTRHIRDKSEPVRDFIVRNVHRHPGDIARQVTQEFGISRQAANAHLKRLVDEGALVGEGETRARRYRLCAIAELRRDYVIAKGLAEDVAWRDDMQPFMGALPRNVLDIWHYGFTEMFNNAIDHSEGRAIRVQAAKTAADVQLSITDDGVGIFRKIQRELGLLDERHAVLELAKGKLTTDPRNHTGEGIFFASRMFDQFEILSGETYFSHNFKEEYDWILQARKDFTGTSVAMKLWNHTSRTQNRVFKKFTVGDELTFSKTIVPVRLAQYGEEALVSRSQAKRLLARVDRFASVIFDFAEVRAIGLAFADEIFRVFATEHPKIEIHVINAAAEVDPIIRRARGGVA
jgi:hypothetical protein